MESMKISRARYGFLRRSQLLSLLLALGFFAVGDLVWALSTYPQHPQKMRDVKGKRLTLSSIKGKKGTLIIFSSNQCPFVKAWMERIVTIGKQAKSKEVGVALINSNDPRVFTEDGFTHMRIVAKEAGMNFAYLEDHTSQIARVFGATRTPEAFLFNAKDQLVYHGAIDDHHPDPNKVNQHYLKDALEKMLEGKAVIPAKTKFIGCSIKFRGAKKNTKKE
jgi:hypothetical protein